MLQKIKDIWKKKGFEIVLGGCLTFIILFSLYNKIKGVKGNYSYNRSVGYYKPFIIDKKRNSSTIYKTQRDVPRGTQVDVPRGIQGGTQGDVPRGIQGDVPRGIPKESKGESECRYVLEKIFRKPFKSSRPDFLRNPVTGGRFNLELDCYNPELNLALEYNGIQHYKFIPYFHRNHEHFINQKYRDDLKRRLCKDNGITLIEVPYTVKLHDIASFLQKECKLNGFL